MGKIQEALPVKLIVGVLTSIPGLLPETEKELTTLFGAIDARSDIFPFDWTEYYNAEMGSPIYRRFLSFADLIDASTVADAKIAANELESSMAEKHRDVRRPVNLDPGYLEQSKIVLASTKNFFHRILIARGIYAEVTLHYQDKRWKSFPWTFPDYGSEIYHPFFTALRENYRTQLRAARAPAAGADMVFLTRQPLKTTNKNVGGVKRHGKDDNSNCKTLGSAGILSANY